MNMVQKGFHHQNQQNPDQSPTKQHHNSSPSKTVLGSLGKPRVSQDPLTHHGHHRGPAPVDENANSDSAKSKKMPHRIEDVPFRRQDRRILNARKKRIRDRKLYKCISLSGFLIFLVGAAIFLVYIFKGGGLSLTQIILYILAFMIEP